MLVGHSRFFRGFMRRVLDMKQDEIGEHSGSDDMGGGAATVVMSDGDIEQFAGKIQK